MGTIPTPPTFTVGQKLTAANLNGLRDATNFWSLTPRCNAYQSAAQSIPSGAAATAVALAAERFDVVQSGDTPMHDNVTNNSRLVCRTAGKYEITALLSWATATPTSNGLRQAQVRLNGTTGLSNDVRNQVAGYSMTCTPPAVEIAMVVGDYVELVAINYDTVAQNLVAGSGDTWLLMRLTGS